MPFINNSSDDILIPTGEKAVLVVATFSKTGAIRPDKIYTDGLLLPILSSQVKHTQKGKIEFMITVADSGYKKNVLLSFYTMQNVWTVLL